VRRVAAECGIRYARTTAATYGFDWPADPMEWHPTCHHRDERLFELADRFLGCDGAEDLLFCVWGHSYEFDGDDSWARMAALCEKLAGRPGVQYLTNAEALGMASY